MLLLLALSAAVKAVYVFCFTDYPAYLFSDMGHYYSRALLLLQGQAPTAFDFEVFPPAASFLLFFWWQVLGLLGLSGHWLEAALVLNIAASTASLYLFWRLLGLFDLAPLARLLTAAAYGLFYPLVYLNAFTLSETPAQLFFLAALLPVAQLLVAPQSAHRARLMLLAGAAWCLACLIRPAYLPCALAVAIALIWQTRPHLASLRLLLCCALGAVAIYLLFALCVQALGGGWRWALTGNNGGMNFFMQQCHYHGAEAGPPGNHWLFVPPPVAAQPELGIYQGSQPFSQQGYYFRAGLDCLLHQPGAWLRLIAYGPSMIYGGFLPSMGSAVGFATLMPVSRHLLLLLVLLLPAGLLQLRQQRSPLLVLLLATLLLMLTTFVLFNADHRHLYSLYFLLLIGACHALPRLWRQLRAGRWHYLLGALGCLLIGLVLFAPQRGLLSPQRPRDLHVRAGDLAATVADGSQWTALEALRFSAAVHIDLEGPQHAASLRLSLDDNDRYQIGFSRRGQELAQLVIEPPAAPHPPGLLQRQVRVPEKIAAGGYDGLVIRALAGDGRYSLAGLRLGAAVD